MHSSLPMSRHGARSALLHHSRAGNGSRPGQMVWHGWCVCRAKEDGAMKRQDVTDLITFRRITKGIKWAEVARKVGVSKEWTTAACLGQMQMTKKQAEAVGEIFALP